MAAGGECAGIFGRLFGHKYMPVFERKPLPNSGDWQGSARFVIRAIEAQTETKFVHTCCRRCGRVIGGPT